MSQAAMEAQNRASAVKFAKTKINRIDQVCRKAQENVVALKNIKDQIDVIIARNADRDNDTNELKDLFAQMDRVFDIMEHL